MTQLFANLRLAPFVVAHAKSSIFIFALWILSLILGNAEDALAKSVTGWNLNQNSNFIGGISSKITREVLRIDLKDLKLLNSGKSAKMEFINIQLENA